MRFHVLYDSCVNSIRIPEMPWILASGSLEVEYPSIQSRWKEVDMLSLFTYMRYNSFIY